MALARGAKNLFCEPVKTKIADVVLDAHLSEVISYGATITEHPVETMASISDHIFKQPLKLKIEGYITDSPIKIMGIFETPLQKNSLDSMKRNIKAALPFFESDKPSKQAYLMLKNLYHDRSLITVVSKLEVFRNMAITNLTFTNNNETIGKLEFVAELVQVVHAKVVTKTITTSNQKLQRLTATPVDKGHVPLAQSVQSTDKSFFASGADGTAKGVDWVVDGARKACNYLFGNK
jgi:hypothetical protein